MVKNNKLEFVKKNGIWIVLVFLISSIYISDFSNAQTDLVVEEVDPVVKEIVPISNIELISDGKIKEKVIEIMASTTLSVQDALKIENDNRNNNEILNELKIITSQLSVIHSDLTKLIKK